MNISNKDKISWHLILKCSEFFSPLITNEYCTIIYYQRQTHKSRSTVQFSYASAEFQTTCLNICQLLTSLCHAELTELTTCITNVLSILTQIKKKVKCMGVYFATRYNTATCSTALIIGVMICDM